MTIPKVVLDPNNELELLEQFKARTSGLGGLTDFSPGSPLDALSGAMVYTLSEMLYYVNKLPEATAFEVFRLLGVTRKDGLKAQGEVYFSVIRPTSNTLTVDIGYQFDVGGKLYNVITQGVVPSGSNGCFVTVEADQEGADYNLAPYSITHVPNISGFSFAVNPTPISGGSSLETLEETLERGRKALVTVGVLSNQVQFEAASEDFLGRGYRAVCYPLLMANKSTEKAGNVHVFVYPSIPSEKLNGLTQELRSRSYVASNVWVSVAEPQDVAVSVYAKIADENFDLNFESIYNSINSYLDFKTYNWGDAVRLSEVSYRVRSSGTVIDVVGVELNGKGVNVPLPYKYSVPRLAAVKMFLTSPSGTTKEGLNGLIVDPD